MFPLTSGSTMLLVSRVPCLLWVVSLVVLLFL